jgi:hypothetical protein
VARLIPPGEPVDFEVPEGEEIFHWIVHFPDGHALDGEMAAPNETQVELRLRESLLTNPSVRGMAEAWGDPGEIEVLTVEEYLTRE